MFRAVDENDEISWEIIKLLVDNNADLYNKKASGPYGETSIVEKLFHCKRLDIICNLLMNGYFDKSEVFREMINHKYYGADIRSSLAIKGND